MKTIIIKLSFVCMANLIVLAIAFRRCGNVGFAVSLEAGKWYLDTINQDDFHALQNLGRG